MKLKFALLANGAFAVPTMRTLIEQDCLSVIVTSCDKLGGRKMQPLPTSISQAHAKYSHKTKIIKIENINDDLLNQLTAINPDWLLVADFGYILPEKFLQKFDNKIINLHSSLLPRWRGANPIRQAIANGDKKSGVTLMQIDQGVDSGKIMLKQAVEIAPNCNFNTLHEKLSSTAGEIIKQRIVANDLDYLLEKAYNQSLDGEIKLARKFRKQEYFLDPSLSGKKNYNRLRALSLTPGIRALACDLDHNNTIEIKIISGEMHMQTSENPKIEVPLFQVMQKMPVIVFPDGSVIICKELQKLGKKIVNAKDFLNGNPWWRKNTYSLKNITNN